MFLGWARLTASLLLDGPDDLTVIIIAGEAVTPCMHGQYHGNFGHAGTIVLNEITENLPALGLWGTETLVLRVLRTGAVARQGHDCIEDLRRRANDWPTLSRRSIGIHDSSRNLSKL